jgi:lipopolysaccharide/colanic/teichoic acid biosynthesis glycosyltransferase
MIPGTVHAEMAKKNIESLDTFRGRINNTMKRGFDFLAALCGLVLLSPIFLFIAALIKRDSPGPVFYWGPRMGRNGRVFQMLKFRTMYESETSYRGLRITCDEDDRITPLGKWLRDTKLNELPQLWNVLIGDMSLVGPRPEDPTISKTWPTEMARWILSVRPGVTSPASVVYRDEERMLHAGDVMRKYLHELSPDKMRLDQLYVKYRSFWLDIDVILWTALLLLPRIRAYTPSEPLLFVGPVTRLIQRYVNWFLWDFLTVLVSIGIVGTAARLFGPLNIGLARATQMALVCALLYSVVGMTLGVNRVNWNKATLWESGRLWLIWLIVTVLLFTFHYFRGSRNISTHVIIFSASLISISGILLVRYRARLWGGFSSRLQARRMNSPATRERVIIVGSGRTAEQIARLMDHPTYAGIFHIVGFIDDDFRSQGMKIYGSKVIGTTSDLPRIIHQLDVGLVIFANYQSQLQEPTLFSDPERFKPARVVVAPDIFGSLSGLGNGSSCEQGTADLNDFQCQHCLARYAKNVNASTEIFEELNVSEYTETCSSHHKF